MAQYEIYVSLSKKRGPNDVRGILAIAADSGKEGNSRPGETIATTPTTRDRNTLLGLLKDADGIRKHSNLDVNDPAEIFVITLKGNALDTSLPKLVDMTDAKNYQGRTPPVQDVLVYNQGTLERAYSNGKPYNVAAVLPRDPALPKLTRFAYEVQQSQNRRQQITALVVLTKQ